MKPVLTSANARTRLPKKAFAPSASADPTEILLAELAERRARLQELIQWIRMHVGGEDDSRSELPGAARTCRSPKVRKPRVP